MDWRWACEQIQLPVDSKIMIVVPGVELCPLVGAYSGSRNLFTGLLTLDPGASYPLYTRPFTEAMIVVEGNASIEVEDRRHRLGPLDAAKFHLEFLAGSSTPLRACLPSFTSRWPVGLLNKHGSMVASPWLTSPPIRLVESVASESAGTI